MISAVLLFNAPILIRRPQYAIYTFAISMAAASMITISRAYLSLNNTENYGFNGLPLYTSMLSNAPLGTTGPSLLLYSIQIVVLYTTLGFAQYFFYKIFHLDLLLTF